MLKHQVTEDSEKRQMNPSFDASVCQVCRCCGDQARSGEVRRGQQASDIPNNNGRGERIEGEQAYGKEAVELDVKTIII